MLLRYALLGAAAFAVAGIAGAQAQSPFPPVGQQQASPFPPVGQQQQSPFPPVGQQQQSPFPPVGQQSPFPAVGQQQRPPCHDQFLPLRQEVDKRFKVTKAALDRRAPAPELCRLLTRFAEAEAAMVKFVQEKGASCNFPPDALTTVRASHSKSQEYRKQACSAAAAAAAPRPRPAEPTLSDALSPPAVNENTTRTGGGTFDSLGGNPLAR